MQLCKNNLTDFSSGYYKDLQKNSVARIKYAQQEIAKIVLDSQDSTKAKIGAATAEFELQIRKMIFIHISVMFKSFHSIKIKFVILLQIVEKFKNYSEVILLAL